MSKKSLPRAVTRTAADMRAAAGDVAEPQEQAAAAPAIETAPQASGPPPAQALAPASIDPGPRRWRAETIVERHANFSAIGGIIPLPLINVASVTTVIVRMVKMLSRHYRVPFERERARAVVIGLVAGVAPTGLSALTASTLFYAVPGANLIGLAVSSLAAAACTRSIGRTFIDHFERGATLDDFPMPLGR